MQETCGMFGGCGVYVVASLLLLVAVDVASSALCAGGGLCVCVVVVGCDIFVVKVVCLEHLLMQQPCFGSI